MPSYFLIALVEDLASQVSRRVRKVEVATMDLAKARHCVTWHEAKQMSGVQRFDVTLRIVRAPRGYGKDKDLLKFLQDITPNTGTCFKKSYVGFDNSPHDGEEGVLHLKGIYSTIKAAKMCEPTILAYCLTRTKYTGLFDAPPPPAEDLWDLYA